MIDTVKLVCSPLPRPSVQKGAKGSQWWKRDVFHAAKQDKFTYCGVDAQEWLSIDERTVASAISDDNLCKKCAVRLKAIMRVPDAAVSETQS